MKSIKFILILLFVVFQTDFGLCQNSKSTVNSNLDRFIEKKMKKAGFIGMQVAFISKGDYIWQGNYGVKEYGTSKNVDENTLFMIASCSKPVTALGVLKLVDHGKVKLDDPVNLYLPFQVLNPKFPNDEITIRMLLAHVSSIKDNWPVLTPLYTIETGGGDSPLLLKEFLINYLVEGGQFYDPEENFMEQEIATEFRYSNVGYALLGYLIECVSGNSFKEFMKAEIFAPLDMNDTYWFLADIPHNNISRPHELPNKKNGLSEPKIYEHYGYPDYPDGQIRTTATDYGKFLNVILNQGVVNGKQFIKKDIIVEFLSIQYPEVNKHQAIAWNYNEYDNFIYYLLMPRLPSHTGADPGVATAVSYDPENKTGAIIFTNSPPTRFIDQKRLYQEIMKKLLKEAKKHEN